MTVAALPDAAGKRGRDPALTMSVVVIWVLMALFILYPLAKILVLTIVRDGQFSLVNVIEILVHRSHYQAFWNSLLLGGLVWLLGTVFGFLFAFTAVRANLPRFWTVFL